MSFYAISDESGNINGFLTDDPLIGHIIPDSAVLITDEQWQDSLSNPGKYIVKNGQIDLAPPPSDGELLASAQSSKIAELRLGYNQTLLSGFRSTIGSTTYTFGWSTDDKANLNACQTAIDRNDEVFPILYSDLHGNPVTLPSQSDLDTIEQTATRFAFAQHQQILNLVGQVKTAKTTDEVNSILWSAASY